MTDYPDSWTEARWLEWAREMNLPAGTRQMEKHDPETGRQWVGIRLKDGTEIEVGPGQNATGAYQNWLAVSE